MDNWIRYIKEKLEEMKHEGSMYHPESKRLFKAAYELMKVADYIECKDAYEDERINREVSNTTLTIG